MPLDNNTPKVRNNTKPVENRLNENAGDTAYQKDVIAAAHDLAERDMEQDTELNGNAGPEKDLDEGELARFEDGDDVKARKVDDDPLAP